MGIFSTIGSLFGPAGTAIGGVADGVAAHSSQKKAIEKANALEMQKFVRLRKAADLGGFHPLEALRSGQSVNAQAAPSLLSTLSASNSFDALENEITGEGAKARRRQEVDDEIQERELERLEIANGILGQTTIRTNRPARLPGTGALGDGTSAEEAQDRPGGVTTTQLSTDLRRDEDKKFSIGS